ncbi:magnesium transporter CorA family protein [Weissella paramesenteroides]|uniref:Magnesium transporter CorA family protein n=1 Tax=Weissella paramesenteroides TaxID=1249 RepID=A0ABD4XME3_WEIPA|nr:CorA family divalent cation transporter [Weissella paramesenteroides]MDF8369959.1 magnesium transporter CorA family protein [Weissella paramesenteroides]MDF8371958.1 magnesium transporter CorA family protein [Weissella paramesenteroides]
MIDNYNPTVGQLKLGPKNNDLASHVTYIYGEDEQAIGRLKEQYGIGLDEVIRREDEIVSDFITDKETGKNFLFISYLLPELSKGSHLDDLITSITFLIFEDKLIVVTKPKVTSITDTLTGLSLTVDNNFAIEVALETMDNSFALMIEELRKFKEKLDGLERHITDAGPVIPVFNDLLSLQKYMIVLSSTYKTDKKLVDFLSTHIQKIDRGNEKVGHVISDLYDRAETLDSIIQKYSAFLDSLGSMINNVSSFQLNSIMKTLTEISIVLTVPSVIYGLWGINTPILFEKNIFGMLLVVLISIILSLAVWAWLRRKRCL